MPRGAIGAPSPAASPRRAACSGLRRLRAVAADRGEVALQRIGLDLRQLARRLARAARQRLVGQQRPQQMAGAHAAAPCSTEASSQACLTMSTISGDSAGARALPVFSWSSARFRSVIKRPWSIS